jgi:hypothetical protein
MQQKLSKFHDGSTARVGLASWPFPWLSASPRLCAVPLLWGCVEQFSRQDSHTHLFRDTLYRTAMAYVVFCVLIEPYFTKRQCEFQLHVATKLKHRTLIDPLLTGMAAMYLWHKIYSDRAAMIALRKCL